MTDAQIDSLVTSLLGGATVDVAAGTAGLPAPEVRSWLTSLPGRARLSAAEHEAADRARRAILSGASVAVRTLIQAAAAEGAPWPSRVNASRTLVEMALGRKIDLTVTDATAAADAARARLADRLVRLTGNLAVLEATAVEVDPETDVSIAV